MQRPYAPMQSTSTTSPSLVLNGNTRSLPSTSPDSQMGPAIATSSLQKRPDKALTGRTRRTIIEDQKRRKIRLALLQRLGQVQNAVVRLVQGWTNQRVHAGVDANIGGSTLALDLVDTREQNTALGYNVPPRLHPHLKGGKAGSELGNMRVHNSQVDGLQTQE
eukprot:m.511539 g.511539  ORF g.511539 m.511539 type:complete len:163 (+) comp57426_c0_seq3:91-579(+)